MTLFNPDVIADTTTLKNPASKPIGIEKVFINGRLTVDNGEYVGNAYPGAVLRHSQA